MTELRNQPCPHLECGSSDAFGFDSDKGYGGCFSCGNGYPSKGMTIHGWAKDKYPLKPMKPRAAGDSSWETKEEQEANNYWDNYVMDTDDIDESADVLEEDAYEAVGVVKEAKVSDRNILSSTFKHFGVKVFTDDNDVVIKHVYPYPAGGTKTRLCLHKKPKKFPCDGDISSLFGLNLFPPSSSRQVTVTEGECDAMAVWQMIQGGGYTNPVVSVPSATVGAKVWANVKSYLDSFDKIILSVDNDKAGNELAETMAKMFLGKVYRVNHGLHKDANDFLMAGQGDAFKKAWWAAKKVKDESILSNPDDYINLYKESPDFEYFKTGIPELDRKMLGICKGYITLIQSPTGTGKSEVMRYLEYQLLKNSDYRVASCRKEETKVRSLLGLVSYDLGTNVTLKKFVDEKGLDDEVQESITKLTQDERFVTFSIDETQTNDETMSQLNYLISAMDIDYLFIEPIQDIVSGANASEKEGKLSDLFTRMGNMCGETGVGIVVIAHENTQGGAMYSSMITKKAGFKIILQGDRESDDPTERNRTYIEIKEKNRVGLGFGPAGAVDFDIETYMLTPVVHHEPKTPDKTGDW